MADSYLAIADIAQNESMMNRMTAATVQQWQLGNIDLSSNGSNAYNVGIWVADNRYLWASSPSWGEKWTYALETHPDEPDYDPGKDESVITDADILATVQALSSPVPA